MTKIAQALSHNKELSRSQTCNPRLALHRRRRTQARSSFLLTLPHPNRCWKFILFVVSPLSCCVVSILHRCHPLSKVKDVTIFRLRGEGEGHGINNLGLKIGVATQSVLVGTLSAPTWLGRVIIRLGAGRVPNGAVF
ncbi:hypothetical protein PIB30_008317 [Stylosanthes scabra]|uniref:Uncharacterized protein n=1 Tax=Stylosanthes scabra TaxID=79078 RepID=A0ABU6S598_9FABA|nr:hypothetical protein [Stylosanthes scabra]